MLPDYEKYMRELCRVRCRQSGLGPSSERKVGIKPLRLDQLGLAAEQVLRGQSHCLMHP